MIRHEYRLQLRDFDHRLVKPWDHLSTRNPGQADTEALAALVHAAYRGTIDDEGEDLDGARAFVASHLEETAILAASWIALDRERPISAILLRRWKGYPLVTFAATHPDHQGRGLALALASRAMRTLLHEGEERVVAFITEGNTASERLFARLGFERFGHHRLSGASKTT